MNVLFGLDSSARHAQSGGTGKLEDQWILNHVVRVMSIYAYVRRNMQIPFRVHVWLCPFLTLTNHHFHKLGSCSLYLRRNETSLEITTSGHAKRQDLQHTCDMYSRTLGDELA